jgi:hypothetical protein
MHFSRIAVIAARAVRILTPAGAMRPPYFSKPRDLNFSWKTE